MQPEQTCTICGRDNKTTVCADCRRHIADTLAWLARIGMPTLRRVAYRQATFKTPSPRHGNKPFAPTPMDIDAQQTYAAVERDLQLAAGLLDIPPIGWDRLNRPRTLLEWTRIIPRLAARLDDLTQLADISRLADMLDHDRARVTSHIERNGEKRLVGICPECAKTFDDDGEQVRTLIYSRKGVRWAVCPACGAFLDLTAVRRDYIKAAGLHITRSQADAARWTSENTGVPVTGQDVKNWRQRGHMPKTRHIEGKYWQWDIMELLALAEHKKKQAAT